MNGLEAMGCDDVIGFDYMSLAKAGSGLLSGFSGGDKPAAAPPPPPPQKSMGVGTIMLIVGACVVGAGGLILLARR